MSDKNYYEAIGRRKRAVARVRISTGTGNFVINGVDTKNYFGIESLYSKLSEPLTLGGKEGKVDVSIKVKGGGKSAQADAVRMGISRALVIMDEGLKTSLSKAGYLKRDPREKERKKYGLKKARKAPQFTKR